MGLEEEIQQGNLRLHKLEEERVRLRKKNALMDVEVKNMEDEIKKDFLDKNTSMVRQVHAITMTGLRPIVMNLST